MVDSWLLVPIENKVEDLFLSFGPGFYSGYRLSQRLYSCSSISKLSLHYCELEIDENVEVEWNQLKSLKITALAELSSHAINRILSGAPLLEELELCIYEIFVDIYIEATSLKMLYIIMEMPESSYICYFDGHLSVLSISAPNLESLEILGLWHTKCLLNVPSLTSATIAHDPTIYYNMMMVRNNRLFEVYFSPTIQSLSHVEKLTLNGWFLKFLVDEIKKGEYVTFPKLVTLIVEPDHYGSYQLVDEYHSLVPTTIFPNLALSVIQLRTIVITWDVDDDSIFPIVEILLGNVRMLEKMVLCPRRHKANPEEFILALEKVLSMRRASTYAEVVISKD